MDAEESSAAILYISAAEDVDVLVDVDVVVVVVPVDDVVAAIISIAIIEPVFVLVERAEFRHVTEIELEKVVSAFVVIEIGA